MANRIEDYALIGDCHSAALVGRDGSIDWLCFPRFDSPACFAALLGTPEHGSWLVAPVGEVKSVRRSYLDRTLVLQTTFETADGVVTIMDCMPVRSGQPDVVRLVVGERGRVRMRTEFTVRFDYGSVVPWVRQVQGGLLATAGPDTLHLHSPVTLKADDWTHSAEFEVSAGQKIGFVLTWHPSHESPKPPADPARAIESTAAWWRGWTNRCNYHGEWRDAVLRSLITLKALTYAPTGGIVAAATTSLPEFIGGPRNWDYRYCWLRDSTFTLAALLQCGYVEEARAWREWLLRAVAGKGDQLRIMYGLAGERRLPEMILDWLPGYENSPPVRIGNAAAGQFQLDVFGEVIDTLHLGRHYGLDTNTEHWWIERELLDHLERVWRQPDEGIWEIRGPRRHFVHSKVMAWVAFDRAVKDARRYKLPGPIDAWAAQRDELHNEICVKGFCRDCHSFTQSYDSKELDASLLVLPLVGFLPPNDPRIVGTVAAIERELVHDGFVTRYHTHTGVDGLPPGEGTFLLCTLWLADAQAVLGHRDKARRIFERVLAVRNDVGLLAEEYDSTAGRQLGNFPQAFSHLSLINTARNLSAEEGPADVRPRT